MAVVTLIGLLAIADALGFDVQGKPVVTILFFGVWATVYDLRDWFK